MIVFYLYWHWLACLYWVFEVQLNEEPMTTTWRYSPAAADDCGECGGCYKDWRSFAPPPGAFASLGLTAEAALARRLHSIEDWGAVPLQWVDDYRTAAAGRPAASIGA